MKSAKKNGLFLFTIIVLFAFMAPKSSSAQDKKVGFGLQATPALAWFKPDDKETKKNGTGFGFGYGLMLDFRFGDNYSLSTGLNLVSVGATLDYLNTDTLGIKFTYGTGDKEKTDTIIGPFTNTYTINYFEFPIHLLLKTNEIGYITYFGQFGLSTQFKTKARVDASVNDIVDEEVSSEIKLVNMSLSMGAGIEYSLGGNTKLIMALIYKNGFSDILKNSSHTANLKGFGMKIGIMF